MVDRCQLDSSRGKSKDLNMIFSFLRRATLSRGPESVSFNYCDSVFFWGVLRVGVESHTLLCFLACFLFDFFPDTLVCHSIVQLFPAP